MDASTHDLFFVGGGAVGLHAAVATTEAASISILETNLHSMSCHTFSGTVSRPGDLP